MRRRLTVVLVLVVSAVGIWAAQLSETLTLVSSPLRQQLFRDTTPLAELEQLLVKGRAPKTGYSRKQFGDGWGKQDGCSMREIILARDLQHVQIDDQCRVQSGVLDDPYTGQRVQFQRGADSSGAVQIDHVVALSDAWQKGAQELTAERRHAFANDPLNLLASDGPANQAKGDADAATWLPPYKAFRCQYIERQVAVKRKYQLWVTEAEKQVMKGVLEKCSQ